MNLSIIGTVKQARMNCPAEHKVGAHVIRESENVQCQYKLFGNNAGIVTEVPKGKVDEQNISIMQKSNSADSQVPTVRQNTTAIVSII